MFSIIIPLYNKAAYIEKALQSVLSQTFKEFELIVVDDGSTDNSLEIVQKFKNSKVQIIEQANSGVSTARNNGVRLAKYDYIAFLDADDWWAPDFLLEMKDLITDFPEAVLFSSSYFKVKNGKNIPAKIGVSAGFERGYFDYCKTYSASLYMPVWTGAAILKKSVYEEMNGFKPTLKLGEDFDLWLRVALKYKVALLNKPLAYYNQDVDLQTRAVGKLRNPQEHMLWHLEDFESQSDKTPYLKQMLDNLRVYGLFPYYLDKNYREKASTELAKVDWAKQPKSAKLQYDLPVWYLKMNLQIRNIGSYFKTLLLKK